VGTALNSVCKLGLRPQDIALIGQSAEHWVGCNCGIMDQLISACGKADHSLLIDCRDLSTTSVAIPKGLSIVIVNSNFKHELAGLDSEYNQRRSQVCNRSHASAHQGIVAEYVRMVVHKAHPSMFA
jgi:galactokinase